MKKSVSLCGASGVEAVLGELKIDALPSAPSAAASAFYSDYLPVISARLASGLGHLTLLLPSAGTDHDDWRRTASRDLARDYAPSRVNCVGGGSEDAKAETLAYLRDAPGVTGQYLPLHD
ncbi:MAG: Rossmann fold domain-containing protein [Marinomonas sp.]